MPRVMTKDEFNRAGGNARYERYEDVAQFALDNPHENIMWVDDTIPVIKPLYNFYQEFKHRNKDAIPVVENRGHLRIGIDAQCFASIAIAFKDAPDIMCGRLFMADDDKNGKPMSIYSVMSPRIKNERYAEHSKEHHIKSSKDFKKAITVARQFIKPKDMDSMMQDMHHTMSSAMHSLTSSAYSKLQNTLTLSHKIIAREVYNMLRQGYNPVTVEFTEALKTMEVEGPELQRVAEYNPTSCFVWLRSDHALYRTMGNGDDARRVSSIDEFPQDIRDKLMVLQLAENNSPILDVGVRVDDTKFWVFL